MLEETKRLIEAAKAGDKNAGDELVRQNTGLIYSAARRFYGRGTETDDLFQIGAVGFIKAVKRFDLSYNVELSTYAVPMIIGEIKRFLRDDGMIKVSRDAREKGAMLRRIRSEDSDIELGEAAQKIGISYEEALYALEATSPPESIDKTVTNSDGEGKKISELIASGENIEEDVITKLELKRAIDKLERIDREIILLRFFREMTQSRAAKILGMSQVQVSRREKKIMDKMRNMLLDKEVDVAK